MDSVTLARALVAALEVYCAFGLAFALLFATVGVGRVDPLARSAGLGFRLLILPASAALWPLLLARWIRGRPPQEERTAHRAAAPEVER